MGRYLMLSAKLRLISRPQLAITRSIDAPVECSCQARIAASRFGSGGRMAVLRSGVDTSAVTMEAGAVIAMAIVIHAARVVARVPVMRTAGTAARFC